MQRRLFLQSALCGAVVVLLSGCGDDGAKGKGVARGSVVLALGDSLTAGFGANAGEDYPSALARQTGWRVINGGISGDTSAGALSRLPALLAEHAPKLVLVSIGGNDFLRRVASGETKSNINQIIELSKESGAQVVLIGIPALNAGAALGMPSDHELYAELAQKHQIPLYTAGWGEILKQDNLRSDQIHPNAAGYAQFADNFYRFLKKRQLVK